MCVYVYMCLDLALSMCGLSCCDVLYILISGKMGFYVTINRILLCLANFWLFLYFIFSRGSVSFFCCCSRPHLSDAKKKAIMRSKAQSRQFQSLAGLLTQGEKMSLRRDPKD